VKEGESIAIVGRSGSGKSTLLSILSAIEDVDVGQVMLKGKALGDLNEDDKVSLRSSSIGVIFQQFHLLSHYTALENVMLPLEIQGGAVDKRLAASLLAKVGLSHREDHYPHQLSGGEKQRVAIARALILNPDVILADEPTGSLDIHTGEEVMDLIFNLVKENRVALVLVTHSMELANRCDKVFRLVEGHLVQE
jgi:putative ABC transport system ATP-binding protein